MEINRYLPIRVHGIPGWLTAVLVIGLTACSDDENSTPTGIAAPIFLGSQTCADCHQAEFEGWQGSHHELAMQTASSDSVLGDFSGKVFEYFGKKTSFFKRGEQFMVRTQNENGEQQDFTVTHTFGVTPLQQYLVEYPGGRKQSLPFSWDARPAAVGGQRWFHLYADEYIGPDDPLHWTGQYFNWNYMCAECHSTNVELGYDIDSNTFETSYSEISVGCESCHGPGSNHISQAYLDNFDASFGLAVDLDDRSGSAWIMNPESGIAELSGQKRQQQQPESCGRCHSRRSVIAMDYDYGRQLSDTHMVSLLDEHLYHSDGRIQDEVYVYGSFVQSAMYAAGVTCGDCHDSHSAKLRAGPNPNETCSQCHLPTKFASDEHAGSSSEKCVGCHMPATTYMGVDDRRDHSFRLPGAGERADHYGQVIAAGRAANANAVLLDGIQNSEYPNIARATMLSLLQPPFEVAVVENLVASLSDTNALVRLGALRALRRAPPESFIEAGSHLLRDPVRSVRIEAALTFSEFRDLLSAVDARAYASASDDYREAMLLGISMPEPATQLAEFESQAGNTAAAERYLGHALQLDPDFALARHSYGLLLVRSNRHAEALSELAAAARLAPDEQRFVYVYGVALNSLGQPDKAVEVLTTAHKQFPADFAIGWALATMHRDLGDFDAARTVAAELLQQHPDDSNILTLLDSLR